jgi:hypothetical protein
LLSILIEAAIAVLAVLAAQRGRPFLYGLALTFAIYVLYDLERYLGWSMDQSILSVLFLIATIAALVSVWGLYKERS